jgi:hypothetical protein
MAEEIIENEEIKEELEEEVKEEDVKEEEEKKEINSSGDEEEDKAGIMKTIINKVFKGKAAVEEEEPEEEGELISEKFIAAASELGWDDETIKEFAADYKDEELDEMIPFLDVEKSQQEEVPVKEDEKKPQEKKSDKEESEELKAMRQELADLKKEFGAVKEDKAAKEQVDLANRVDSIFDKASEKFEVFGKTEELPKFPAGPRKGELIPTSPAYKARTDVFGVAAKLLAGGSSVDEAMKDALDWYKGKNLEKDVKRNLVKDLKSKEKKLSAKRMGKETVKVYKDDDEEKSEVVLEAYRKAGVKGI